MKFKNWILSISLVIILFGLFSFYYLHMKPARPNIILILIDALRKDHLGCYGYQKNTSPNIDLFAEEAFKFEDTISTCSWTSPSIASLFTSLYVSSHGLLTHSQKTTDILDLNLVTLAEVLKENGYTASAFVANRWIREEFNYHQGFDLFKQVGIDVYRPSAASLRERFFSWLADKPQKPFFAYLHFMDVHGPYLPPYPYNTLFTSEKGRELTPEEIVKLRYLRIGDQKDLNFYISQYDGGIRYCDYHIGKILDHLKKEKLYDESVIIITSDHGEAFFEHGACDHGFTLYNEEIRVPLLMRLPSSMPYIINEYCKPQLSDIGVTLLNLIGTKFPYQVDGQNLVSLSKKKTRQPTKKRIYSEEYMKGFPKVAVIENDRKYIYHIPQKRIVEVYNLANDDKEYNNLVSTYESGLKGQEEKEIEDWLRRKAEWRDTIINQKEQAVIDPRVREQLKSLGYLHNGEED